MKFRLINFKTKPLSAKYLTDVYDLSNGNKEFIYCCVPNGELGITVVLSPLFTIVFKRLFAFDL